MTAWVFLAAAIGTELIGTLALRVAATGRRVWYAAVLVAYAVAFGSLALALAEGMALGVAYGIWSACGVALAAIASRVLFEEPLTGRMAGGILLIAAGVLLVQIGAGS